MTDFVTLKELSQRLERSEKTLRRLSRERNGLPLHQAGSITFAFWSEVEAWLRSFDTPRATRTFLAQTRP